MLHAAECKLLFSHSKNLLVVAPGVMIIFVEA